MPRHLLLFLLMLIAAPTTHAAPLQLVASIKPVTLITSEIAPADARIHTLIPPGASPHTYQLRPSDRRALSQADAILWVGPSLETFLQRLLDGPDLAPQAHALAGEAHHQNDTPHHDAHGDHHHSGGDPHLWVSPEHGRHLAERIATILIEASPGQAEAIRHRLATFKERLSDTEASIHAQLSSVRQRPFFIYHPAFTRFADHFNLTIAGTLTHAPERQPGARHLSDIQKQLASAREPCLLSEEQFRDSGWQSLSQTPLPQSTWDPLATDIQPGEGGYSRFLKGIAQSVLSCTSSPQP